MSLWRRLFGQPPERKAEAPGPTASSLDATPRAADPTEAQLARLGRLGAPDGPDAAEALAIFARLRTTPREGAALAALADAGAQSPLPDALATAAAKASLDRGELPAARRFLRTATSPAALLLAADLAEQAGEPALALALTERVLARDFGMPGAKERHARLALSLGHETKTVATVSRDVTALSASVRTPYVLRRELARGGAAAVYEAEDRELGRRIALKVYHDAAFGRAQLLHEARVATELSHPGVVRVFDVDVAGGWLVLELFDRGSLRERLRDTPGDLAWLPDLLRVVSHVHAHGYAHLDVKPGNVLVRDQGVVLTDFGTARRLGEPSPPGSLGYVSPERLAGAHASVADDVYGVGRMVEDALRSGASARWRQLADVMTGPAEARPRDLLALAEEVEEAGA